MLYGGFGKRCVNRGVFSYSVFSKGFVFKSLFFGIRWVFFLRLGVLRLEEEMDGKKYKGSYIIIFSVKWDSNCWLRIAE